VILQDRCPLFISNHVITHTNDIPLASQTFPHLRLQKSIAQEDGIEVDESIFNTGEVPLQSVAQTARGDLMKLTH